MNNYDFTKNGTFRIMQLKSDDVPDKYHGIRFSSKKCNDDHGIKLTHEDYTLVFEGNLSDYPSDNLLESIYVRMNEDKKPEGYSGYSLSTSDVIIINNNGIETAYYCDTFGFTEMPEFFTDIETSPIIRDFKAKTAELFNNIRDYSSVDIEETVKNFAIATFRENNVSAEIKNIALSGSRCRGLEHEHSDIDVVIEVESNLKEDALFNILNEENLKINNLIVDINPIKADETRTLEMYLPTVETYLAKKITMKGKIL